MPFPNYPEKYNDTPVFTGDDMIAYRRILGRMPKIPPPEGVIFCLQRGLPERLRRQHPYRKAGRLMGDLYLLKKTGGKVAVLTNFGIGAPLVAALAEELIAWGAKRLITMAWTGGLQPDLKPGDIVICESAIRDEGTSHHYLPPAKYVPANPELVSELVHALNDQGQPSAIGTTWTTDAPYRETHAEVKFYQKEGVKTVEMEAAALLAVAQVHHVQATSAFVIGDSLAEIRWQAPQDINIIERSLEAVYTAAINTLAIS